MKYVLIGAIILFSAKATGQECQTPELLRGQAVSFDSIKPPTQPPKGEFETTSQYQARTTIAPLPDPLLLKMDLSAGRFEYDADTQRFAWEYRGRDIDELYLSIYSDMYSFITGGRGFRQDRRNKYDYNTFVIKNEHLKTEHGYVSEYRENDYNLILFDNVKITKKLEKYGRLIYFSEDNKITTNSVQIDIAPQIKKGLVAVVLARPKQPYFISGEGTHSYQFPLTNENISFKNFYSAVVADLQCVGLVDSSGKLLATYGFEAPSIEATQDPPVSEAQSEVTQALIKDGRVSRGWLGVAIQDLTPDMAEARGLKNEEGSIIADVTTGSPAEKGGLERGDVILSVNGQKVNDAKTTTRLVGKLIANTANKFEVLRGGKRQTISVTVGERPDDLSAAFRSTPGETPPKAEEKGTALDDLGVTFKPMDEERYLSK